MSKGILQAAEPAKPVATSALLHASLPVAFSPYPRPQTPLWPLGGPGLPARPRVGAVGAEEVAELGGHSAEVTAGPPARPFSSAQPAGAVALGLLKLDLLQASVPLHTRSFGRVVRTSKPR